ncbi:hypothetical protein [Arthrobacter cryoconiti]|uniref:Uncharacterized protein n=1 Tax=Arthrobacter cryoconiti TaxID=748907 RepID=A0ABV8QX45_9MICC|nr:hypothetical protein [Arthrobacter cryoconiti]MCC9069543.1 hypothetical protein [Arthrobacter cryoconiti]
MRKHLRHLLIIAVSLLAFAWVANVGLTFIDEGKTPPSSAFPGVPGPAVVKGTSKECGSGGCWREMVIEAGSPQVATELINQMNLSQERCSVRNLLTLSRICTGSRYAANELRVFLRYDY